MQQNDSLYITVGKKIKYKMSNLSISLDISTKKLWLIFGFDFGLVMTSSLIENGDNGRILKVRLEISDSVGKKKTKKKHKVNISVRLRL